MTDDRPRGSCVIPGCPRDPFRREDGRLPLVCGPDVSLIRHWLIEVPRLAGELGRQLTDASMPDPRGKDISIWLPSMATSAPRSGGRVSGSAEPRLPIAVDVVDLLGPRRPIVDRGEDGTGFDSIWSVLSFWCVDLAEHRGLGERGQRPGTQSPIPWLAKWLLERVDEAADDWPLFADFFSDLGRIHGALRNLLGLVDVPDYKAGVPCPKCNMLALIHKNGTDRIECTACGCLLKPDEYEEHVKSMSVEALAERKKATADRRALVRLLRGLHAAGWRHSIEHIDSARDADGAPWDDGSLQHTWLRGKDRVWVQRTYDCNGGPYKWIWSVVYDVDPEMNFGEDCVSASVSWVAANGIKRLHALASAAGVLALPKERQQ